MLSVQPKLYNNYGPTFKASENYQDRELTPEQIEEREYLSARKELQDQQDELLNLAQDNEIKMPKIAKKALTGGAIITTGILGGMATGFGTKKTIQLLSKINKSKAVEGLKKQIKATNEFAKKSAVTIKKEFKASDAYRMPANAINKFANTKVGKPVVGFFKAIGKGVSIVYNAIKTGVNKVVNKIKSVKKETYEKATVNFMGASGGVASGVTAVKEKSEAKGKE